jgi:polygalacturonase
MKHSAIQSAIDAANKNGGGRVLIPGRNLFKQEASS